MALIPSADDTAYPLVADASGNIPSASAGGLGFAIVPVGLGAAFPVVARLGKSNGGSKNLPVFGSAVMIEADGFEQMEIRGAKPGSTWMVYTLTEAGDDVRANIAAAASGPAWRQIYDVTFPNVTVATAGDDYWLDWAGRVLILGKQATGFAQGVVPGLDLTAYTAINLTIEAAGGSGAVVATMAGRPGPEASRPISFYKKGVGSTPPTGATVVAAGLKATADGPEVGLGTFTAAGTQIGPYLVPFASFGVNFGSVGTWNSLRAVLWGCPR